MNFPGESEYSKWLYSERAVKVARGDLAGLCGFAVPGTGASDTIAVFRIGCSRSCRTFQVRRMDIEEGFYGHPSYADSDNEQQQHHFEDQEANAALWAIIMDVIAYCIYLAVALFWTTVEGVRFIFLCISMASMKLWAIITGAIACCIYLARVSCRTTAQGLRFISSCVSMAAMKLWAIIMDVIAYCIYLAVASFWTTVEGARFIFLCKTECHEWLLRDDATVIAGGIYKGKIGYVVKVTTKMVRVSLAGLDDKVVCVHRRNIEAGYCGSYSEKGKAQTAQSQLRRSERIRRQGQAYGAGRSEVTTRRRSPRLMKKA